MAGEAGRDVAGVVARGVGGAASCCQQCAGGAIATVRVAAITTVNTSTFCARTATGRGGDGASVKAGGALDPPEGCRSFGQ